MRGSGLLSRGLDRSRPNRSGAGGRNVGAKDAFWGGSPAILITYSGGLPPKKIIAAAYLRDIGAGGRTVGANDAVWGGSPTSDNLFRRTPSPKDHGESRIGGCMSAAELKLCFGAETVILCALHCSPPRPPPDIFSGRG